MDSYSHQIQEEYSHCQRELFNITYGVDDADDEWTIAKGRDMEEGHLDDLTHDPTLHTVTPEATNRNYCKAKKCRFCSSLCGNDCVKDVMRMLRSAEERVQVCFTPNLRDVTISSLYNLMISCIARTTSGWSHIRRNTTITTPITVQL
jgi:dolichyl-phosphate-mannose--protein O-mannosyl transferase